MTTTQEQTKVSVRIAIAILTAACMPLIGCASFERTPQSGYAYRNDDRGLTNFVEEQRNDRNRATRLELGPGANDRAIALRQVVKREEQALEGKYERETYYKAKPHMRDDAERLNYLRLESTAQRENYLAARGITSEGVTHPPAVQALIEQNDIAVGMTREAVKDSWGAPDETEVAGNRLYGNEKWYYSGQVTSSEGYATEKRVVIFAGGRVVGWETH